jgi:hypothetical protein
MAGLVKSAKETRNQNENQNLSRERNIKFIQIIFSHLKKYMNKIVFLFRKNLKERDNDNS